jgi:SAM-dependent methyltransferase
LEAFSHFVHCDERDAPFFDSHGVPVIWLPQCVDHHHFHPPTPGTTREPLVYFRGKVDDSYGYQQRRVMLDFLKKENLVAVSDSEISPQQLMEDYRKYALAINLPGNFGGYNVRTFEALASGSILLQYLPEDRSRNNTLFEDRRHLFNFDCRNPKEVVALIREIRANPDVAARVAEFGRQECLAKHTLEVRIRQIIDFVAQSHHASNKLHIGCGDNILKGFCNVDCRSLNPAVLVDDASQLSNVKDGSYDVIYACHVLEHFSFHAVQGVLENWVRKLKPGGRIFIAVPNFRYLAARYLLKGKIENILPPLLGGQEYRENFHYCAFDKRSLGALMKKVGLQDVGSFKASDYDFTAHDCSRWPLSLNMVGRRGPT